MTALGASNIRRYPVPGTVVWTPAFIFFRHKGVVSDHWIGGKPMIISGSSRASCVCEESWDDFAQGNAVYSDGYPSALPSFDVLRRARSVIGTQYRPFDWNCEHVVAYAHGLEPSSPQVALAVLVAVAFVGIAFAHTR